MITFWLTCGERKICSNIKKSQNIINMIVEEMIHYLIIISKFKITIKLVHFFVFKSKCARTSSKILNNGSLN